MSEPPSSYPPSRLLEMVERHYMVRTDGTLVRRPGARALPPLQAETAAAVILHCNILHLGRAGNMAELRTLLLRNQDFIHGLPRELRRKLTRTVKSVVPKSGPG